MHAHVPEGSGVSSGIGQGPQWGEGDQYRQGGHVVLDYGGIEGLEA